MKNEFFRRGGFLKIRRALLRRKLRDNRLIGGFFNADCEKRAEVSYRKKIKKFKKGVNLFAFFFEK